ncbi:tRNA lysidine(34) synthetase TilS [Hymenobacter properus]|uniref:tRNA(Ile)-lysidine synthase n=1 Tax=Hymenobacter properus TaxID=2791026 RepID=A0A931BH02_9BACT|nr:tRNA lysidine(34) synthetase TilS [Hymenobacter properus]MBF9143389.1 tRNA lysidine(34) synthetase TilS [Hymenobacter properus]MBR7722202.1 tRNA lysidine(34) synthetase TilS [Microvirga sp. SRT04]
MLDAVRRFIEEHDLFSIENDPILVAVSGGLDSVVLLDILHRLKVQVAVAHCHFGLRGEDADADEQFVRKLAKQYGLPYFAEFFRTKEFAEQEGISTQMAARLLRYRWFEQVREREQLAAIATAHHQRDQAETMILNLTHGTGLAGLHGIQVKNGHVVRPLLGLGRDDLHDYLVERGLRWREDDSNDSPVYQRNLLRHEVLPVLREINPNLDQTMAATAERVGGAEEIVRRYVEETAAQARRDEAEVTYLNISTLQKTAATTVVLHELLRPFGFSWLMVKDIVAAFGGESGRRFDSPTHRLVKDRENLVITPRRTSQYGTFQLAAGQTDLLADGMRLKAELHDDARHFIIPRSKSTAALDADKLKFPLTLRRWQEGDWFMPLGMKGKKLLSDFLIDQKVPLNLKDEVRVLTSADGKICWVVGWRVDDRFKVEDATERVLTVQRM